VLRNVQESTRLQDNASSSTYTRTKTPNTQIRKKFEMPLIEAPVLPKTKLHNHKSQVSNK